MQSEFRKHLLIHSGAAHKTKFINCCMKSNSLDTPAIVPNLKVMYF